MNEPPQIDPLQNQPNQYSQQAGTPPHRFGQPGFAAYHRPPPGRGGGKLLAILGGGFLFFVLLCGGGITWLIASFQSKSVMTAEYQEHREPIAGPMPSRVIEVLKKAKPVSGQEAVGVAEFLVQLSTSEDSKELVDVSRFVVEMQHSGQAVGVNALTRLIWIDNLRDSLTLPSLSDNNVVIDVQWLVPEKEACATIVSYWEYNEEPDVWLLYLTRSSGHWKLYDWRNVLDAASDSQYYALYTAAGLTIQENYSQLTFDIDEIYNEAQISNDAKAAKILAAFHKRPYPPQMQALALDFTASYLLIVEGYPQLKQLISSFDDSTFAGAHYYRGRLAQSENDKPEAFRQAQIIVEKVGWHPAAAILAGKAAETDEQKLLAADWLATSLSLASGHDVTLEVFMDVAQSQHIQSLVGKLAELENAQQSFVAMMDGLRDDYELDQVSKLAEAAKLNPSLKHAAQYGELLLAASLAHHEEALKLAAELLRVESFADHHAAVWQMYFSAALGEQMLKSAAAMAPDRDYFLHMVRDHVLNSWGEPVDWRLAVELLQDPSLDQPFRSESETEVAIGRCLDELGEHAAAFARLLPVMIDKAPLLLGGNGPDYGYTLVNTLAASAIKTEKTQAMIDVIADTEAAFVVLASKLNDEDDVQPLEKLIAWYDSEQGPEVWKHYYQAQVAFTRGRWEDAEVAMLLALDAAEFDARFADGALPDIINDFAPFSDDYSSEWLSARLEFAMRCGKLTELVDRAQVSGEFDGRWANDIEWLIGDLEDIGTAEAIGKRFVDSGDPRVVQVGYDLLAQWNIVQGQSDTALELLIRAAAQVDPDDSYYGNRYLDSAARLMASTRNVSKLTMLRELANTANDRAMLDAVAALANGDVAEFKLALKNYEDDYERDAWCEDVSLVSALQAVGFWDEVNANTPANAWYLTSDYKASGLLMLNQPSSQLVKELESSFSLQVSVPLEAVEPNRFPGSVCAWTTATRAGRWLIVGYDGLPPTVGQDTPFARRVQSYAGCVYLSLLQHDGRFSPLPEMRQVVSAAGRDITAAKGFFDQYAESWFEGDDWHEDLGAATQHGINRSAPKRQYGYWSDGYVDDSEPTSVQLHIGLLREIIKVDEAQSQPGIRVLAQDSLAAPCLRQGTRVDTEGIR